MYKKILVPLDGSDTAEMALPHACALAKRMRAELVLLRVSAYPTYDFLFVDETLAATLRQTLAEIHDQEATYLKNLAATLSADGLHVTTEHREGDAAHTILDVAQRLPADLIVMSTHGRGGFRRWLVGSVASKIVQRSSAPVLLVRPTEPGG